MSPFAIFAIVLTIAYVFYFGIVIAHDLYGKKGEENTDEEHFDVSSMQDTEEAIQVEEKGEGFRVGSETISGNNMPSQENTSSANQGMKGNTDDERFKETAMAKKISFIQENMEEIAVQSSYAMSGSELRKALMSGEVSQTNGVRIQKIIVADKV